MLRVSPGRAKKTVSRRRGLSVRLRIRQEISRLQLQLTASIRLMGWLAALQPTAA